VNDPGPRRTGARAFRPRLDESVDGDSTPPTPPTQGQALLPFAEPFEAPVARPRARYRKLHLDDLMPDVRDGLTRPERIVLWMLHEAQKEFPGRNVPTALLYGRVVEHVNLSVPQFQNILARMVGVK
jgi:hypothetical protein